ncbi:MAG: LCP family protein, partial [Actinomycetota bacterium]|nr:LCP family protein [Actinomycetota bacterium]
MKRRHQLIGGRRWPRRVLIAANLLTVMCLVSMGAVYLYAKYRLDQIHTIAGLHLSPDTGGGTGGLTAMNILLVGNNSRVGLSPSEAAKFGTVDQAGGAHSDVTMVLHLDPATGTASLLSIPRDLFVPLPPKSIVGPVGKIDSALNGTNYQFSDGAENLIETIQTDLGIPINHYVSINFDGFQQTVDALGGINLSFPTQLYDLNAALRITQVGCDHLNGTTALAVVRSRHLQYQTPASNPRVPSSWPQEPASDLARIQRDQTFLRVFVATAKSQGLTTDLFKLNNILGALTNQISVDPALKSKLIPLVKRFRNLNENAVPTLTLPVTVGSDTQYRYGGGVYGQVDFPVEPADHQVITQWQGQPLPKADPARLSVIVHNISSVARQAADTTSGLVAVGFNATNAGQATVPATTVETVLRYHPGSIADAETVLASLSGSIMMQSDPSVAAGTVGLDAGSSLSVLGAPGSPGTAGTAGPAPSTAGPAGPTTAPST